MRLNLSDIKEDFDYRPPQEVIARKSHGCLKFFGCLILILAIIFLIGCVTVKFVIGPVVQKVNELPADFPKEFALYQAEQAKIKLQTPASKQKILRVIDSLPDWALTPFLNYLSTDLKTQLAEIFGDKVNIPENFTVQELRQTLEAIDPSKTETVSLSWDNIDKSKEDLAAYYKNKLADQGFEFKENLEDYQINLGFWKEKVFGTISLSDSFKQDGRAAVDMTINYLLNK